MTEEDFAKMTLLDKWIHIADVMSYIQSMDKYVSLRMRYNTNHPEVQRKQEERRVRTDQYDRWRHIKDLYAAHRDELANTFDNERYQECRSILEKVFVSELDDAIREVVSEE